MIKTIIGFNKGLGALPKPWRIWLAVLVSVNLIGPFFFIETLEAKLVLTAMIIGFTFMMILFHYFGYVRLLGLGHIAWVPLVLWLTTRLVPIGIDNPLGLWLLAVIVLDSLSLLIDAADVVRYILGDRTPSVTEDSV